jgi:intron-binding protein aquarius
VRCRSLRGAEVIEIRDADGNLFNDFRGRVRPEDAGRPRRGSKRTLLLALDCAQYQLDVDALEPEGGPAPGKSGGAAALYASFNVVQRRKAKENNFKAVLESIRDLMTESTTIPDWMHDLFLGYGSPEDTQYKVRCAGMRRGRGNGRCMHERHIRCCMQALANTVRHIDFRDTFLDAAHVADAFPEHEVQFVGDGGSVLPREQWPQPPFRVTFPRFSADVPSSLPEGVPEPPSNTLVVQAYQPTKSTPFPQLQPGRNSIRFNREQLQVILAGLQPGLTMCVGPPGTGKTDTAVQVRTALCMHAAAGWPHAPRSACMWLQGGLTRRALHACGCRVASRAALCMHAAAGWPHAPRSACMRLQGGLTRRALHACGCRVASRAALCRC